MDAKYSFRPYALGGNKILMKLTVLRNGEYVLVSDGDAKHYEEHVNIDQAVYVEATRRAFAGTLGGHQPPNPAG
jgi:hypothetical protein